MAYEINQREVNDYDAEAADFDLVHDERDAEIAFYCGLITPSTTTLLDVACGTGALTIPLWRAATGRNGERVRVTGIDLSVAMLERAERANDAIRWILADVRDFAIPERFDLATCACNSLQHLLRDDELLVGLAAIRAHLRPGGILCFDVFNPDRRFLDAPRSDCPVKRFVHPQLGREIALVEDTSYDEDRRVLELVWRYLDGTTELRRSLFRMRQYFPAELDALVRAAGFVVESKLGDFEGSTFGPGSPKQILVCRKRGDARPPQSYEET